MMLETSADLLRRAVMSPETMTPADHARLGPEDRSIIARVLAFHSDATDMELARRQRMKRTTQAQPAIQLIPEARWGAIIHGMRTGTMRMTELTIEEILAIDNDPARKAAFDAACDQAGWLP